MKDNTAADKENSKQFKRCVNKRKYSLREEMEEEN